MHLYDSAKHAEWCICFRQVQKYSCMCQINFAKNASFLTSTRELPFFPSDMHAWPDNLLTLPNGQETTSIRRINGIGL